MRHTPNARGFTLIEALLAVFLTSVIMLTVGTTFVTLLEARDTVDDLAESTEAGPRILNLIERDLQGIWTFNVGNNAIFRGRDMDVGGQEADRMDFLTTTDAVGFVLDLQSVPRKPSVCEVGYWFKPNPRFRDCFELWRREDPMVDDDLLTQGSFQLVHDRIKSFHIGYYRTLGATAVEEQEWDSAVEDALPARIKIEFKIERKRGEGSIEIEDFEGADKTYVRHIVFDQRMQSALANGSARIPVFPPEPQAEPEAGGVPQGGGGPLGGGGPAGLADAGGRVIKGEATTQIGGRLNPDGMVRPGQRPGRGGGAGTATGTPGIPGGLPPGFDPSQLFGRLGGAQGGGLGGLFGGTGGGGGRR
ncbi:MAG: type II secretion system protein J [Planctomycetota bacterium]